MANRSTLFGYSHQLEMTAEERGYEIMGLYESKDEINHVLSQLHGSKVRAFKACKSMRWCGKGDQWALYVKTEDLYKLRSDYKPPEKPRRKVNRGGRRKDMAIKVIKMRKEDHMEWEDIARELERSVNTVKDYFYRYSSEKSRARLTDWPDDRRPEGYDPETGLIRKEKEDEETHSLFGEDIPQT